MKTADFIVDKRPRLAAIEGFPKVDRSDYERRLSELQGTLQRVQQAYLGTPQRAVIVLEGWDTAGKGGVVRRLGWALDPRSFKVAATAAPGLRTGGNKTAGKQCACQNHHYSSSHHLLHISA